MPLALGERPSKEKPDAPIGELGGQSLLTSGPKEIASGRDVRDGKEGVMF